MESPGTTKIRHIGDIYPIIGDGRYQLLIIITGCIATIPIGMQEFMLVFLAFNPGWECETASKACVFNGTVLPGDPHFNARCTMNRTDWKLTDTKGFSIVNEFNLFCDQDYWIYTSSSMFYLGNLIGALVSGWLSDRIGRTKVLLGNYVMVLLTGLITSFLPNLWLFELIRLLTGVCVPGTYMVMVVLSSEIVSERFRPAASIIYWIFYSGGVALLGVKAFYLHSWRKLLVYSSVPYILTIILLGFLPESFVWLHVQGKEEELQAAIRKIARINRRRIPKDLVIKHPTSANSVESGILLLFRPFSRLITTLPMMFTWFAVGIVYFGISLAADDLTGNEYRDFVLLAAVDIPAALIAILSAMKFGRKKTSLFSVLIGGFCIASVGLFPESSNDIQSTTFRLIFGISAKLFCSVTFDVIVTWCAELYPTKLRSKANGVFNSCLIFGGMCAPWVSMRLHSINRAAPFFAMGSGMLISSILLIKLSETKGKRLPERTNTGIVHQFDNVIVQCGGTVNRVAQETDVGSELQSSSYDMQV